MADVLDTNEQVNLLFKKFLNKPCTSTTRLFFEEPNITSRSFVNQEDILTYAIPSSAPTDIKSLGDSDTDDNGRPLAGSYAGKTSSVDSNIRYYHKIPLDVIPGTGGTSFQAYDATTSHPMGYGDVAGTSSTDLGVSGSYGRVMQGSIPFNQASDGSYGVTIYTSTGVAIPFGQAGGGWILDSRPGVLTFFLISYISTVSATLKPYVSFYRYVGLFGGTSNSQVTDTITGNSNTYTSPQVFDGGSHSSTADTLAAVLIDDRDVSTLSTGGLLNALQLGGNYNLSWRVCVQKTSTGSALLVQARENGSWATKALFSTP